MTDGTPVLSAQSRLSERVRAFAGLAAIGASIGLALGELFGAWQTSYFVDNAVPQRTRIALLGCLGFGALTALIGAGLFVARLGTARLAVLARLLAPLGLVGFASALLRQAAWSNELELSIALAVAVVCSRPLFRMHFSAYDDPLLGQLDRGIEALQAGLARKVPALLKGKVILGLVILAAASYAIYMASYTVLNHLRFGTNTWDLITPDSTTRAGGKSRTRS